MELYEFNVLLNNLSEIYSWACSTKQVATLDALSE